MQTSINYSCKTFHNQAEMSKELPTKHRKQWRIVVLYYYEALLINTYCWMIMLFQMKPKPVFWQYILDKNFCFWWLTAEVPVLLLRCNRNRTNSFFPSTIFRNFKSSHKLTLSALISIALNDFDYLYYFLSFLHTNDGCVAYLLIQCFVVVIA